MNPLYSLRGSLRSFKSTHIHSSKGGGRRRLFLNQTLPGWGRLRLPGLRLLSRRKCGHRINGMYLPGGNLLRADVFRKIAEELLDLVEVILPICVVHLSLQTLLRILKLVAKR